MRVKFQNLAFTTFFIIRRTNIVSWNISRFIGTQKMADSREKPSEDSPHERAKAELRSMFDASVRAVLPSEIIDKSVSVTGRELRIYNKTYELNENVYLVGFGKAVLGMASIIEEKLGPHLKKGIVSIPRGSMKNYFKIEGQTSFPMLTGVINYRESSIDNQPDTETLLTTHEIIDMVENLKESDTLIVLISGGGSALLYMPRPVIQPTMKLELCKKLQNSGANIKELNTVRKKLSMVKGGGLAQMAYPARVISLILSDIVDDPLDLIASGPTVYSDKAPDEVISILKKYQIFNEIDDNLKSFLSSKETKDYKDLLNKEKQFVHVDNVIVGNNRLAIEAASREACRKGLSPIILRNDIVGDVRRVSEAYARLTSLLCHAWDNSLGIKEFFEQTKNDPIVPLGAKKVEEIFAVLGNPPGRGIILIGGGEPTVVVEGTGRGGRNQELALRFSLDWLALVKNDPRLVEFEVTFLSAGTDGQDGPTDATGAFGYPAIQPMIQVLLDDLRKKCNNQILVDGDDEKNNENSEHRKMLREAEKIEPIAALKNSDSYNFYSRFRWGRDLVKTGITGTNVMDLHFVLVKKRECGCKIDFERGTKCPNPLEEHDLHTDADESSTTAIKDVKDDKEQEKLLNLKVLDTSLGNSCKNKSHL